MSRECAWRKTVIAAFLVSLCSLALAVPQNGVARNQGTIEPDYVSGADGPVTMAVDAEGVRWAVWSYASGLERDIAVSRNLAGTWTPPALVGEANGLLELDPVIGFLPDGRAVIAWTQSSESDGITRVVFSFQAGASWSAPRDVLGGAGTASTPRLLSIGGDLILVFVNGEGQVEMRALIAETVRASGDRRSAVARTPGLSNPDTPKGRVGTPEATERDSGSNGPDPMPGIRRPPPSTSSSGSDPSRKIRQYD